MIDLPSGLQCTRLIPYGIVSNVNRKRPVEMSHNSNTSDLRNCRPVSVRLSVISRCPSGLTARRYEPRSRASFNGPTKNIGIVMRPYVLRIDGPPFNIPFSPFFPRKSCFQLARIAVPQSHRVIVANGRDQFSISTKGDLHNLLFVTCKSSFESECYLCWLLSVCVNAQRNNNDYCLGKEFPVFSHIASDYQLKHEGKRSFG